MTSLRPPSLVACALAAFLVSHVLAAAPLAADPPGGQAGQRGGRGARRPPGGPAGRRLPVMDEQVPKDVREAVERASGLVKRGHPRKALEVVRKARDAGLHDVALSLVEADAWVRIGRADLSLPLAEEYLEENPWDPYALGVLARGLALVGEHAEAEETFALALDGQRGIDAAETWIERGDNLRAWGEYDGAIAAYEAATERHPSPETALSLVALTYVLQGRLGEAADLLAEVGETGQNRANWRLAKAMLSIADGRLDHAAGWLAPVSRRADAWGIPRLFYADVLLRQGVPAQAARVIEGYFEARKGKAGQGAGRKRARELPRVPRLHAVRAQVLLARGEIPEALEELARARSLDAADPSVLVAQARIGEEIGDDARAREACDLLDRFGPGPLDSGEADLACAAVRAR